MINWFICFISIAFGYESAPNLYKNIHLENIILTFYFSY